MPIPRKRNETTISNTIGNPNGINKLTIHAFAVATAGPIK
jgi:hypothetical protein